jgi:hypothetical protein
MGVIAMPTTDTVLLEVKGLIKHFPVRQKAFRHRKGMVEAVDVCKTDAPLYRDLGDEHFVACRRTNGLDLQPICGAYADSSVGAPL